MNTLSDEQLVELEGLYQKATPGEWLLHATGTDVCADALPYPKAIAACYERKVTEREDGANAQLIAALHNAFPAILSAIQSLRTKLDEARDDSEELRKIKDYLWPNQTGMPNEHRNTHIAIEARHRLMMAAKEKAEQERDSLRAELAASKEREQGLRDALKEIAKDRSPKLSPEGICLECSEWTPVGHPEAHDHKEGCSNTGYPKGFNQQRIAREALSQPSQSPWRPEDSAGGRTAQQWLDKYLDTDNAWLLEAYHNDQVVHRVLKSCASVGAPVPIMYQRLAHNLLIAYKEWFQRNLKLAELLPQPPTKGGEV